MLDRIQVRALAGPLKDIQRLVPMLLLHCLVCVLPVIVLLEGWSTLGRVLVVQNFFHLRMIEATVFLGNFKPAEIFWYPSPDLCLETIEIELMCIRFPLIILDMFFQLDWSPLVVNSIDWT